MKFTATFTKSNDSFGAKFNNIQYVKGHDGYSAYEIALKNGFEGTEQEWLASLKGEPGKPGKGGEDGYTPIRGTDYWTEQDIAEIKAYVDDAIEELDITVESDINNTALWEKGLLGMKGQDVDSDSRIRTIDYIPSAAKKVSVASGYEFGFVCYNDAGEVKTGNAYYDFPNRALSSTGVTFTTETIDLAEIRATVGDYTNFRVLLRNASNTSASIGVNEAIAISFLTTSEDEGYIHFEDGGAVVRNEQNANNPIWSMWNNRLSFGMNKSEASVPFFVDGQMLVDGTLMLHNSTGNDSDYHDRNRWGFHLLEGYLRNNYARWTVIADKNIHDGKTVVEDYLYTGADHSADSYGWRRIGSDVSGHSFLFDRDVMLALGAIRCYSPFTLANINPSTDLDYTYETVAAADSAYSPQRASEAHMKRVRAIEIANAADGCMYYDAEAHKVKAKVNGAWTNLYVEADKDEMVSAVLAALPVYNGEVADV